MQLSRYRPADGGTKAEVAAARLETAVCSCRGRGSLGGESYAVPFTRRRPHGIENKLKIKHIVYRFIEDADCIGLASNFPTCKASQDMGIRREEILEFYYTVTHVSGEGKLVDLGLVAAGVAMLRVW